MYPKITYLNYAPAQHTLALTPTQHTPAPASALHTPAAPAFAQHAPVGDSCRIGTVREAGEEKKNTFLV